METLDRLAGDVSASARRSGCTVAVAESLTGGMVASALAAAGGAAEWFRGSLVAYASEVKHDLLAVPEGPVVSAEAARAMATGVRKLLGADVAVAVTGAGGPDPQDGRSPGTVFLALDADGTSRAVHEHFEGEPGVVCAAAAEAALRMLVEHFRTRDTVEES